MSDSLEAMLEATDPARSLTDEVLDELVPESRLLDAISARRAVDLGAGGTPATVTLDTRKGAPRRRQRIRLLVTTGIAAALIVGIVVGLESGSAPPAAALDIVGRIDGTQVVAPNTNGSQNLGWTSGIIMVERPAPTWQFTPGSNLSQRPGQGVAYRLLPLGDPATATRRVATIFGVAGTLSRHQGRLGPAYWTIGGPTGPQVSYAIVGEVPFFSYARSTCEVNAVDVFNVVDEPYPGCARQPHHSQGIEQPQAKDVLTHPMIVRRAAALVRKTGFGYGIAQPQTEPPNLPSTFYSPKSTNWLYDSCGHACRFESAGFDVAFNGVPSGQNFETTFDQSGGLLAASGPALTVGKGTSYPLMSAAEAVQALDQTHPTQGFGGLDNAMPLIVCRHGHCHTVRCPVKRCRIRELAPYPVRQGTLNVASLTTSVYVLKDHSLVTLPTYSFGGATTIGASGSTSPLQGYWTQLAVVPSAVHYTHAAWG